MDSIRVVEIGGTHIRRADIRNGEVSEVERRRTAEVLVGNILKSLEEFTRISWNEDIEALVFLVAGPIDEGEIIGMPNFPEFPQNTDLSKKLEFKVPIFVFNDMTAATIGMAKLRRDSKPFWGLTWSTGLNAKFWNGQKISIDKELGHEIKINNLEAESLLGGRHLAGQADGKDAAVLAQFLLKLDQMAASNIFVFKGAIAEALIPQEEIQQIIKKVFTKDIELALSPEPQKDSFVGAWELVKKVS